MISTNFFLDAALRVLYCTPTLRDSISNYVKTYGQNETTKLLFSVNDFFNQLDVNFKNMEKLPIITQIEFILNQLTKDYPLSQTFECYFFYLQQYLEDLGINVFKRYDTLGDSITMRSFRGFCHVSQIDADQIAFFLLKGAKWYIFMNDLFTEVDFFEIDHKKTIILFETNGKESTWKNLKSHSCSFDFNGIDRKVKLLFIDSNKETVSTVELVSRFHLFTELELYAKEHFPYSDSIKFFYINEKLQFTELKKQNYHQHMNQPITVQSFNDSQKYRCIILSSIDPIKCYYCFAFAASDPKERLREIFEREIIQYYSYVNQNLTKIDDTNSIDPNNLYVYIPGFKLLE